MKPTPKFGQRVWTFMVVDADDGHLRQAIDITGAPLCWRTREAAQRAASLEELPTVLESFDWSPGYSYNSD